jgi:hypothetical protein
MTEEPTPEAPARKSMLPFILVGVVLVALGVVIAVWQVGGDDDDDGPDYEADCRLVEEKAPDLGPAQAQLLSGIQAGPGAGQDEATEGIDDASVVFQEMADELTDREFADDLSEFADTSARANQAMQDRDLAAMAAEVPNLTAFLPLAVEWLDDHCPRWLGPGQWGEPGSEPTGPTDVPSFPTGFPSGVPSLPSDFPSLPSDFPTLSSLPTPPG